MTRACHIAVRSATGDVFSDAEIDDFLDRLGEKARRARRAQPTLDEKAAISQAAAELTREQLLEALTEKRLALASEIARNSRRSKLDAMPATMSPAQKLEAFNVGSERQGFGTESSVDAEGRARQMMLWGQVERGLNEMPGLVDRLSNPFGISESGFDRKVATEMARLQGAPALEPTGDEGALHAARVFVTALEDARTQLNDEGAFIGKRAGYIVRQAHDADKIAGGFFRDLAEFGRRAKASGKLDAATWQAAADAAEAKSFGAWRDFILPKLDPKTFDGLEERDVGGDPEARQALEGKGVLKDAGDLREAMLHTIWQDIVTGRHAVLEGAAEGDFRPKASRARSVSQARVLHFTSPDDWADYNAKFGRGPLFGAVMGQLERAGRNAALMRHWGPAPEAAFEAEKERLATAARQAGRTRDVIALDNPLVKARFEQVNGTADVPANPRFALVMRNLRGWEALVKLGSIVLSKSTDLPITGQTFARAGAGFFRGYGAFFEGVSRLGSPEAKRAAELLDVGARSFAGHLAGQFGTPGVSGWIGWATRLMYRINLFEWFNNGVRGGAAIGITRFLGQEAEHAWDQLPIGTRETLERFAITPAEWEHARAGLPATEDGKRWFTLDHLDDSPILKLKLATLIHDWLDDTVSEPRAREKSGMTRGAAPGTIQGEFLRGFMQFKGFINAIVGRQLVPASRGFAGMAPVATLAHLVIGTILAGWVSANAKRIVAGEKPVGLYGDNLMDTGKIWANALAQGGGLGLYGDFLFGEQNRTGGDFDFAQLGGPILSDAEQVAKLVRQAVMGGAFSTTGKSPIPGELVRLGGTNIPLINVWYTRLALDYLILWRLQEAASPGYLERYESRVKNQEGRDFWLSPTSAAH